MTDCKGAGPESAATDSETRENVGSGKSRSSKPQPSDPQAAPKSWRDVLPVHPAADLFPLMSPDELRVLGADIIKNGLTSPVVLWSDGTSPAKLLDGRSRLDSIENATASPVEIGPPSLSAGKDFLAINKVIVLDSSVDAYAYVISANIHRRHLDAGQKRVVIANLIKVMPEKSDRQIAEMLKADHKTVASVRAEMEGRGEIPHVDTRTDSKGRQQPARKASTKPTPSPTSSASARREVTFDMSLDDYHLLAAWCDERDISCVEGIRHIIREALDAAARGDIGPDNAGERPAPENPSR
jgi:hypothetical protein